MEKDPLIQPLQKHPEYEETIQKIRERFWQNQAKLRKSLEENELI